MHLKLSFVFILICPLLFSQKSEGKQIKRLKWFSERHYDSLITNNEEQRWKVFQQLNEKTKSGSNKSAAANWECFGPVNKGGRMLCHAFDPFNTQIIWAGSASGGLWKTVNGGGVWTPMTDNQPNLAVGAIAIHPQNPLIMLMGTGEVHVPVAYGGVLENLRGNGIGVLRSIDGGLTWASTSLSASVISSYFGSFEFAWDPLNTNKVFIATSEGVYFSTDAGLTWVLKVPGIAMSVVMNKSNPSIILASIQDYAASVGGIYRSTDGGINWNLLGAGLPASDDTGYSDLSICDSFPNVIFTSIAAAILDSNWGALVGLYKSSNGGDNWNLVSTDTNLLCNPYAGVCLGWYANTIAVSPSDSNLVLMGGVILNKSTDGGISWIQNNYSLFDPPSYFVHPDHHDVFFDPVNNAKVYSFNDGGVYYSANSGNSWLARNNGLVTFQYYGLASSASNSDFIVGGTQDNGIHFSNLGSFAGNWNSVLASDGFGVAIDPADNNVWYQTDYPAVGWTKTIDGGSTYFPIMNGITEAPDFYIPLAMDPMNSQVLYTASSAKIYKSSDGGLNWNSSGNIADIDILAIDKINSSIIYACTKRDLYNPNSVLYISSNGGLSWNVIPSPGNVITDIECDPLFSGTVYVTRSTFTPGQQIFRSTDFGANWYNAANGFPGIPAHTIVINPNNTSHLYAGTDLGVFLSIDGGTSWNQFNDNLPNVMVADMHYSASDSSIRAGTYGRGCWITKAVHPNFVSIPEADNIVLGTALFPNPFRDFCTFNYTLKNNSMVNIKIFNYLGQEVAELVNAEKHSGPHQISWNGKSGGGKMLSDGIYFFRLQVNEGLVTHKVILQNKTR